MPRIELNIDDLTAEKQRLGEFLADPLAFNSPDFMKNNKRFNELDAIIAKASERETLEKQLAEARELANGNDKPGRAGPGPGRRPRRLAGRPVAAGGPGARGRAGRGRRRRPGHRRGRRRPVRRRLRPGHALTQGARTTTSGP